MTYDGTSGAMAMVERRSNGGLQATRGRALYLAAFFAGLLLGAPDAVADQIAPLAVERPPKQTMVLTQGFSTTIHSERPFGKISITDPDIVDLVVRTDKSAVLIPQRLGRTNVDFLDDHGSLIGSMDVRVVRQSITDRVTIYNRPSLGAYSAFHCGPNGCAHFEEMPDKEEALSPSAPQTVFQWGCRNKRRGARPNGRTPAAILQPTIGPRGLSQRDRRSGADGALRPEGALRSPPPLRAPRLGQTRSAALKLCV